MYYVVTKLSSYTHQMTFEEFLGLPMDASFALYDGSRQSTSTRTFEVPQIPARLRGAAYTEAAIDAMASFCIEHSALYAVPRHELYHEFRIPKRSGGFRKIRAPHPELKAALYQLGGLLNQYFGANRIYHTSAYAFIKGRSHIDSVRVHQQNESWWFAKLDLKDFFGSVTKEFAIRMLSMLHPFAEVLERQDGREVFENALELAFLDGVLPQGSPLSPLLTNLIMVPIDFTLSRAFRQFAGGRAVYTRYVDDMLISSRLQFNVRDVEALLQNTFSSFGAPLRLNPEKTRYGSRSGSNWNLGVVLNKDNNITVGYKNLRRFKSMLYNFRRDNLLGVSWEIGDIQHALGLYAYYRMVDAATVDNILNEFKSKYGFDVIQSMKQALSL